MQRKGLQDLPRRARALRSKIEAQANEIITLKAQVAVLQGKARDMFPHLMELDDRVRVLEAAAVGTYLMIDKHRELRTGKKLDSIIAAVRTRRAKANGKPKK